MQCRCLWVPVHQLAYNKIAWAAMWLASSPLPHIPSQNCALGRCIIINPYSGVSPTHPLTRVFSLCLFLSLSVCVCVTQQFRQANRDKAIREVKERAKKVKAEKAKASKAASSAKAAPAPKAVGRGKR